MKKKKKIPGLGRCTPVIPDSASRGQENGEFEASLSCIERHFQKKRKRTSSCMLQPSRDLRQGGLAGVGGRQNILLETEGMRKEMRNWWEGGTGGEKMAGV